MTNVVQFPTDNLTPVELLEFLADSAQEAYGPDSRVASYVFCFSDEKGQVGIATDGKVENILGMVEIMKHRLLVKYVSPGVASSPDDQSP
jgi:hypothetical protein